MAAGIPNTATEETDGYAYEFVQPVPDRLICRICHDPCHNAYMTICCGHNFCESCLNKAQKITSEIVCPVCRKEDFQVFPNSQANREIRGLHVFCVNKQRGCECQCEINEIINHCESACLFQSVCCPIKCGKVLNRRDLADHAKNECPCRTVVCQYCYKEGEYQYIAGKHFDDCTKAPIPCANKCTARGIPRDEIILHMKECPLQIIQCEFHNVGCEEKIMRKDLEKHNLSFVDKHLMLAVSAFASTEQQLYACQNEIRELKNQQEAIKVASKHEIECLKNNARKMDKKFDSEAIQIKFQAEIDKLKRDIDEKYAPQKRLQALEEHLGIKSGQIIGYLPWAHEIHSTSIRGEEICPVIIKVPKFHRMMKNETKWHSDPFYSHIRGYKLCLRVIAAGSGSGRSTHLSLFLYIMRGQYDGHVKWPIMGAFEISLINQLKDAEHYPNTVRYSEKTSSNIANKVSTKGSEVASDGLGRNEFISLRDLIKVTETCQYLKDDCIFIRVCKL